MFTSQTRMLHLNGIGIRVHLISTGSVAVKTRFRQSRFRGFPALVDGILDKNFTEWMPIWILVIEHPEGIFVIDTGEIADLNRNNYFRSSGFFANWFDTSQFRFRITREEEIDHQLELLGISGSKRKVVVLTHLHFDHTDGLRHFRDTAIIVNRSEWIKPFGDLPALYPDWFQPTLVDLDETFGGFTRAYPLTRSGDLFLIETPGHTFHHCSVILKTDEAYIFFAADICYSQNDLLLNRFAASHASLQLSRDTYRRVRTFIRDNSVVFIPSHDGDAANRLKNLDIVADTETFSFF